MKELFFDNVTTEEVKVAEVELEASKKRFMEKQ